MKLKKEDKELWIYLGFLAITLFLFCSVFMINQRGNNLTQSPRLLPLIVTGCMFLLSGTGVVKNIRAGGRIVPAGLASSIKAAVCLPHVRQMLLSIAIVTLYIFVGVQFIGFYVSSFLLICAICLLYVKFIKPVYAVIISLALTGFLYLIFAVAFNLRLR